MTHIKQLKNYQIVVVLLFNLLLLSKHHINSVVCSLLQLLLLLNFYPTPPALLRACLLRPLSYSRLEIVSVMLCDIQQTLGTINARDSIYLK